MQDNNIVVKVKVLFWGNFMAKSKKGYYITFLLKHRILERDVI